MRNKWLKYGLSLPIILYTIISLYPLLWLLIQSLKTDQEFFANSWALPSKLNWDNYTNAWLKAEFGTYYFNSIIVTGLSLLITLAICALAGYAFGRFRFPGKKTLISMLLGVLLIPSPVLLLPVFFIVMDLGLLNTYAGLIGPYVCGSVPIGLLLMSEAFRAIPNELDDSARLDGYGDWQIFFRIMLPLTVPTLGTLAILTFMSVWTEYMWALISISNNKMFTISVGMAQVAAKKYVFGWGTVFAGMVITSSAVVMVYIILQKYFLKALSEGAVKG